MMDHCDKHGPYSTFCRECDLDTIDAAETTNPPPTAEEVEAMRERLTYLAAAVRVHADKFPSPEHMRGHCAKVDEAATMLAALAAENEGLRAGLEPFAKMGRMLDGPFAPCLFADDKPVGMGGAWLENGEPRTITFGDLRNAATLLERKPVA